MQFCCITTAAKYWPHDTIVKLGAEMRNLCRLNKLKKKYCPSDLIWHPFWSSQGSFILPTSHSWRLRNFICMEQLLYSIGHEWFHPSELAPGSWHGIVRAHINENPCCFGGFVVFTHWYSSSLFVLIGGVITEATGKRLYFIASEKPGGSCRLVEGKGNTRHPLCDLINRHTTANKTQNLEGGKNACTRTDVETRLAVNERSTQKNTHINACSHREACRHTVQECSCPPLHTNR